MEPFVQSMGRANMREKLINWAESEEITQNEKDEWESRAKQRKSRSENMV